MSEPYNNPLWDFIKVGKKEEEEDQRKENYLKNVCSSRWGSSLPGLRTLDPLLGLQST